ncbi:DUF3828 domain-containing protein [Pseudomonas purpurea]|uniref:DUF3828 domain-containing protein n=1 Tax=Pseudomonas purpurea TaxID=3136737 RepID=UPI00326362FE
MKKLLLPLLAVASLHTSLALAECASSPRQATEAFYTWYLMSVSQDKNPLTDDVPQMKQYVSEALIRSINKQMASPDGLDEDYFIKAQDYMDEWVSHIAVSEPAIQGASAKERVTLGNTPETTLRLEVRLVKDKTCWKIDDVQAPADQNN